MSDVNQAFNDFLVRVDEYLADRDYDGDEINDFIVEHNDELIKGFNAGKSVHDTIADIDVPAVAADSVEEAANKAEAALKEKLDKSGIKNFNIQSFCSSVVIDKNKTYVEAINLYDHPDICSVAEYFEDAGLIKVADEECYSDKFFDWLAKQPTFKLFECDITLVRVEKLWTALISVDNPTKLGLPLESLEDHVVNFLANAKTLPNGSPNPAKGSVPVPTGYADEASKKDCTPETEVFKP